MYLKGVELYGFKSFADKTLLTFDRQLSAVVGPNGCGKSNVVDAIRWCLGEQSAHSLRTPHMLGIVFNGSQTRAPLNLAEVSLTFDNSSNILPIDYTEVTITRRLFRSGESEYYINKTQCRLKDIRDMFLDTGVGREGYSIFEQGKVEFITNAKPEDRRALFEEAAGVSKYKVRREETLHKLERVHQDMNRVNDIMSVIKEQINSLESAVRKAKLYQKHIEELRTLEIADSTKKIAGIEEALAPTNSQIEELNNKLIEKNTHLNQSEADLANIQVEKTNLDKELTDTHEKLSQIDTEIAQLEERIKNSQDNIKEFKQRQETLQKNIGNFASTKKSLENQINKINTELQQAEETFNKHAKIYEEKKNHFEHIKSEISGNQHNISKLSGYIYQLIDKKTHIHNELASISNTSIATKTNISNQNQELKKISEEKSAAEKELKNLSNQQNGFNEKLAACKKEYDDVTSKITELKEETEILEMEKNSIREKFYILNSRIEAIREIQQKDPKISTVNHILSNSFTGIHGTVNGILNISQFQEELVGNLLGEKLHYIISDTIKDAQAVIEYLEQNKKGWASFIVLEALPELPGNSFLGELRGEKPLGSVVSYDPKWEKLVRFLFHNTYFSGNTIHQEAIIHGGIYETKQVNPEVECRAIEEQLAVLKKHETANKETLEAKEKEIPELTAIQKQKYDDLQHITFSLSAVEKELSNETGQSELIKIEEETIQSEIKRLTEEGLKLEENAPLLKSELSEIDKNIVSSRTELARLETLIADLKNQESGASCGFTEAAQGFSTFEERMKSYKREHETLHLNLKLQEEQYILSLSEIQLSSEKVTENENIFTTESKKIDKLYEDRGEFDKKLNELKTLDSKIYTKMEQKQHQLANLRNEIKLMQEKTHELQIVQKTKEVEKNGLENKLRESGVEYADSKENYLTIEVDPEEIIRLRRRIESIGPVNLTAQEQYTDLEKRHNFLLEQQQDLLKAEEDLRLAISKINSSIQENFHETFDKVRENFKTVFSQLFEGGESDLILTDENDLLNSGIDIVAQPQGKKLQSISLLSGGEKALTAIALLFAFFMVRPSPICILDEVDAPLDESNVMRFINLIKSFSTNSQFLMITHNKRTMEAADILYGVTMEEFGISKIISIRLHKQEIPGIMSAEEKGAEEPATA